MNRSDLPGLYVHVPFCRTKCPYCDFYSVASKSLAPAWVEAVQREAAFYEGRFSTFDTIYLGGGTPTLLDEPQLASLMDCFARHFSFSHDTEITIEANPDDLSLEKLKSLRRLGFNRISVGVQSFDEEELRFLKRRHTAGQTEKALHLIRECGFDNLGLDLIYGFDASSGAAHHESTWAGTLKRALEFKPEHLSCYQMTFEEGTPFGKMKARGKIKPLGEEVESSLFLFTSKFLQEHGYIHYEISNFAANPGLASRHNQKYWRHVPYLGLGPAAHSFQDGVRWWNKRDVRDYTRLLARGKAPVEGKEHLSDEQIRLESLYLGLRTRDGIELELVSDCTGSKAVVQDLERSELVTIHGQRMLPTIKGFLVADSLPLMFFD